MRGHTTQESTRPPGELLAYGMLETYDDHVIDQAVYQYEVAPVQDEALGKGHNPQLVHNKKVDGWIVVGPDPDGHPDLRLIARRLDHPKAVAARKLKAKKDAKCEPAQGQPTLADLLKGGAIHEGKAINLGEALAQHPSEEQLARDARASERLAEDPMVKKMVQHGIDLDSLDDD